MICSGAVRLLNLELPLQPLFLFLFASIQPACVLALLSRKVAPLARSDGSPRLFVRELRR